jgi:hypothetical protein
MFGGSGGGKGQFMTGVDANGRPTFGAPKKQEADVRTINGEVIEGNYTINGELVDGSNPTKNAAPTGAELTALTAGFDKSNTNGAFDFAPDVSKAMTGSKETQNIDWGNTTAAAEQPLAHAPPLADFFKTGSTFGNSPMGSPEFGAGNMNNAVGDSSSTFGGGMNMIMGDMPDLPPMDPMPMMFPMPEEPPPLPEPPTPPEPEGHCEGGHVTDIHAFEDCSTIEGFLSLDFTGLNNVDALSGLTEIVPPQFGGPAFGGSGGIGLQITNNDLLSDISGLGGLAGKIPGGIVIENNPVLTGFSGLGGITGLGMTDSKHSLVAAKNPQVSSFQGFGGLSGAVPGGVNIQDNTGLRSFSGLGGINKVGADSNGIGLQVSNNGAADAKGLGGLSAVGGSLIVANNANLKNVDAMKGVSKVGTDKQGVSLNLQGNPALGSIGGLGGLGGDLNGAVHIHGNDALKTTDGLQGVSSLGADSVSGSSLLVTNNNALTNLNGLKGVQQAQGAVQIAGNPSLRTAQLPGLTDVGSDNKGTSVAVAENQLETKKRGEDRLENGR